MEENRRKKIVYEKESRSPKIEQYFSGGKRRYRFIETATLSFY